MVLRIKAFTYDFRDAFERVDPIRGSNFLIRKRNARRNGALQRLRKLFELGIAKSSSNAQLDREVTVYLRHGLHQAFHLIAESFPDASFDGFSFLFR